MSNFSGMKVAELKEELSLRGLSTSGKKADLLERLESSEVEEAIEDVVEKPQISSCPGCKRSDCCFVRLS